MAWETCRSRVVFAGALFSKFEDGNQSAAISMIWGVDPLVLGAIFDPYRK